jgi:hypothetical protein
VASSATPEPDVDAAVRRAREVVGLYGDPAVPWGIFVELGFTSALDVDAFPARLDALMDAHPHLGRTPEVRDADDSEWASMLERVAMAPFDDRDPLVRVVVARDRRRLVLGAHHGVCDGLGLLALADAVTEAGISTAAQGIGDRQSPVSFLRSSLSRLAEALVSPPARFRGTTTPTAPGELLVRRELPATRVGTSELASSVAAAFEAWRADGRTAGRRPLLVYGASRRPVGQLAPDRRTAYFRLPFDPAWSPDAMREAMARLEPEPTFPETSAGGVGPWVTHALRNRLGSTAVLSNLGIVRGRGLASVAMHPVPSGPRAVAIGLASTSSTTTVTLRSRRAEFTPAETEQLLEGIVAALPRNARNARNERTSERPAQ